MKSTRPNTTIFSALLLGIVLTFSSAFGATVEEKAKETVIPKLVLKDASVEDAFKDFTKATGIKVFYFPPKNGGAKITLSLTNIPASEALKYITSLANLVFVYAKDGVHVTVPTPEN